MAEQTDDEWAVAAIKARIAEVKRYSENGRTTLSTAELVQFMEGCYEFIAEQADEIEELKRESRIARGHWVPGDLDD